MKSKINYTLAGLLFKKSPTLLVLSMLAGLLAGIGYSLIIPFLFKGMEWQSSGSNVENVSLISGFISNNFISLYFLLCILILLLRSFSLIFVTVITKDVMADLRVSLCKKIHLAKVKEIENIGFPKLINMLTQDVQFMGFAASGIPILFIESITILGLLAYLFYLDWKIFVLMSIALMVSTIILRIPLALAEEYMAKARHALDQLQYGVKGLISGSYELKLSHDKASAYINEEIEIPERVAARHSKIADSMMMCAGNIASIISFLVIGVLAFVLPQYISMDKNHTLSIVLVMLYVISPIAVIFSVLPNLRRGNVALKYTMDLYNLEEEETKKTGNFANWNEIIIENVSYRYTDNSGKSHDDFILHPINLRFRKGEITFIVGGNGSGKSTLSKIISLHYSPMYGQILFGETKVDSTNIALARNQVSVIYTNYFLFEKLYQKITSEQQQNIDDLIFKLGLANKTKFIDGRFTTTNLSDGQRRRLALLVAIMEDRDIYIFDEWAADQDPIFKETFYKKIIHDLKSKNKLVIVVTHDDRYFDYADHIVYMEDGKINSIRSSHV